MSNLLSYKHLVSSRNNFRSSGTKNGDEFNIYDIPAHKYFKMLFYFGSDSEFGDTTNNPAGSGLLAPTWEYLNTTNKADSNENGNAAPNESRHKSTDVNKYYMYNSAWAYLMLNDELERAEKLIQFVTLLSDINSNSPWYFSTVSGLSEALERKVAEREAKFEIVDKKITIECMPDAFDNRIDTLLSLYRDITWSWTHKKEIVPANLRKFDMAIYIFETPENNWHTGGFVDSGSASWRDTVDANWAKSDAVIIGSDASPFQVSYKMIEFHDCEINYNAVKTGWGKLDNQAGVTPTFQIEITYGDCYEVTYNDIMMRTIGDVILTDLVNSSSETSLYLSSAQEDDPKLVSALKQHADGFVSDLKQRDEPMTKNLKNRYNDVHKNIQVGGALSNAVKQVAGHAIADVSSTLKRAVLGNLYSMSLTRIKDQVGDLLEGNLIKTGMTAAAYLKTAKELNPNSNTPIKNLYNWMKDTTINSFNDAIDRKIPDNIYDLTKTATVDSFNDEIDRKIPEGFVQKENELSINQLGKIPAKEMIDFKMRRPNKIGNIFSANTLANNL